MELGTGYTTGTCAAAAAKGAACLLIDGFLPSSVELTLPRGESASISICGGGLCKNGTYATVEKDAGDDPDVTNGALITVHLSLAKEFSFAAGAGVGVVTKRGLQIPVGEAAINPVPREMMVDAISEYISTPVRFEVSVDGGEAIANKTFNPRLGIKGGISIIGTTGIVRPYNRESMQESIRLGLNVLKESGATRVVITPGNIGAKAAFSTFKCEQSEIVEVGNEWGLALDFASKLGFQEVVAIGHPGKLCKMIRGDFFTRSGDSPPCLNIVEKKAKTMKVRHEFSKTVEGVFTSIEDRRQLGDALAFDVAQAISSRVGQRVSVYLTLMSGEVVGVCDDK